MKRDLVKVDKLKSYVKFLLDKHLDDLVKEDIRRASLLELPLLNLFGLFSEIEKVEFFKNYTLVLFTEILEGKAIEGSYLLAEKFKKDKMEVLSKEKIDILDITLSYNVIKNSFLKFLPFFTNSLEDGIEIMEEVEDFFTHRQSLILQCFVDYQTENLRNSEEYFKSLAESSFEGVIIYNGNEIQEVNQVMVSIFGFSKKELIGKELHTIIPNLQEKEIILGTTFNDERKNNDSIGIRKDGSSFPIEIMERQITYKGTKVSVVSLRDISERKSKEVEKQRYYEELEKLNDQLRKEKDFVNLLIDNAYSRILVFDRDMTITFWNKKLEEIGIKKEDAIGKNYYDIFPSYKGADEWMENVWKGEKVILRDKLFRQRKGYFDAEIIPIFNDQKEVIGALSDSRDITERKKAEVKLRESEHLLREITDSSPSHIYVFDYIENKSIYDNKELLAFLGYTEEEIKKLGLSALPRIIHPEDLPKVLERQKKYENAKDTDLFYLEYRVKNAKNEWRWHGATTKIFKRTPEGKVWQVLGIANDITEKKQIEQTLVERTQTFQTILDSIPVKVFWKDCNNNLLGFNKAFQKAINIPLDDLLVKKGSELFSDEKKCWEDDLEVINSDQAKLNIIESVSTSEGVFHAKTDKVPLKDLNGKIVGVIGTAMDITELKRVQQELCDLNADLERRVEERTIEALEREKQYRFLSDFLPQVIWTSDGDGNIDYYNKNWFEYTGLNLEESKGDGWKKAFHPEDLEKTTELWLQSIKTGEPYQNQFRYLRASDNTYRWQLGRAVPLKDPEGNIIKWFGSSTDIHDQKMSEESLKIKALVLENMVEGVSVSDEQGYIIYTNSSEDKMFGYDKGELIGKHVSIQNAYTPEENIKRINDVIEKLHESGSWSGEWNNIRKDGTIFNTFAHISTLNIQEKKLFVCVQRDITEEKKFRETIVSQNEELIKINNDLDNFIYTASHDLKAPVSNIEGLMVNLIEIVNESTKNTEDFQILTSMMFQSIQRFKNTILDLTEISKVQKNSPEEESFLSVCEITEEVREIIMNEIFSSKAVIDVHVEDCPFIPFSRKNFRSIIYNLMINAIKYRSPERAPYVEIRTYENDNSYILEVKDNGLGIKPENKEKIFHMFKRLHDHVEGSGVGLYIVKRIVNNAGGTIEVESEEGVGSVFKVVLKKKLNKEFKNLRNFNNIRL